MDYYTALLNAVDCSIHLHEPSQRSAVNYFCLLHGSSQCSGMLTSSIFDRCQGKFIFLPLIHVISITPQSGNLSTPASSVAKQRQRLWPTISLLTNTTSPVHPVWAYFPDNDRRSIHYPLLITWLFSVL